MARLLSDENLAELARTPRQQLADALAADGGAAVAETFVRLGRSFRNFIDGFSAFLAGVSEHVQTTHGFEASSALHAAIFSSGMREIAARQVVAGDVAELDEDAIQAELVARATDGDRAGAMDVYDEYERRVRIVHDLAVGRVAAALTHVYRTFGVDELEACIRLCGERSLLGWMPKDMVRPAQVRVAQWAQMMSGNFATIRVEETDDAFVITQDPCGTCARQVLDGCYAPPVDFAVVEEKHPITWMRGGVPIYRTHVSVMHDLIPMERHGARWPEITCPGGLSDGPCTVVLRK
jgi:hypothetical protein